MADTQLTLPELRALAERGALDVVIMAIPDMQGRLQGKRVMPRHFLEMVAQGEAEGCAYLLATDIECQPIEGYAINNWEKGFGISSSGRTSRRCAWPPGRRGRRSCCAISSCPAISRPRWRRAPS
ncbi:hypothetical protein [Acidocella sp. MX-AZ03]|uniref:hypothetical protein n=1 Tax=Acidocella sp. MX-AZ03 TaxID=2697363 RepID=UPI0022DDECA5|nr:hypothetical protein [Acidocella sp. MX-AZ03]